MEGPIEPREHYFIPPLERVDLDDKLPLIRTKKYSPLHAPRLSGKPSTLEALAEGLNDRWVYRCLRVEFQGAQSAGDDLVGAIRIALFKPK